MNMGWSSNPFKVHQIDEFNLMCIIVWPGSTHNSLAISCGKHCIISIIDCPLLFTKLSNENKYVECIQVCHVQFNIIWR